jgi:hypothetical protein
MEEYVEGRASVQPENVIRLTAVRVNRNSAVHVSRDTYAGDWSRDVSYFNLNNTEAPTAELLRVRSWSASRPVGRCSFGVLVACVRRPRDLPTANWVRAH